MKCISVLTLLKTRELKDKREIILSLVNVSYENMDIHECLTDRIKIMHGKQ